MTDDVKARLEYLRGEIAAERISMEEIAELQSLVEHIDPGDVQMLEWAGVAEFPAGNAHFPKFVMNSRGDLKGEVTSATRRCQMEGCGGRLLRVKWPDGAVTHPCSKGTKETSQADTWQIG